MQENKIKQAIITGASKGIGKAIAFELAVAAVSAWLTTSETSLIIVIKPSIILCKKKV